MDKVLGHILVSLEKSDQDIREIKKSISRRTGLQAIQNLSMGFVSVGIFVLISGLGLKVNKLEAELKELKQEGEEFTEGE